MTSFHERLYALQQQMDWRIKQRQLLADRIFLLQMNLNGYFGKMGNRFGAFKGAKADFSNFKKALDELTELRRFAKH